MRIRERPANAPNFLFVIIDNTEIITTEEILAAVVVAMRLRKGHVHPRERLERL